MTKKIIKGLREIYDEYDAFFIDLWGVVHNGIQLYPQAVSTLENLNKLNKRFVLIPKVDSGSLIWECSCSPDTDAQPCGSNHFVEEKYLPSSCKR